MNPKDVLISYTLALYSTWFYHKPTGCLFDAGEGVATTLGKKVFGIRYIFLSHGHEDHIGGISNFVNIRNLASGEREKPLTIYYPKHDPWINVQLECIEKKQTGLLRYPLYVQPLEVGDEVELEDVKRPIKVTALEMEHARGQLCLSYEIAQEGKVISPVTGQSMYKYHPIFFYSGDGYKAYYTPDGRVDIAVHEATFLDRDAGEAAAKVAHRHSTVETTIDWAARMDVKILILSHISDRYLVEDIIEPAKAAKAKSGFRGELYVAYRGDIISIDNYVASG